MEQYVFEALYGVEVGMAVYDVVPFEEKEFIEVARKFFNPKYSNYKPANNTPLSIVSHQYAKVATNYFRNTFPEFDKNPSKYLCWIAEIQRNLMLRLFNRDFFIDRGIELYGNSFFDKIINELSDFGFLIPGQDAKIFFSEVIEFISRQKEKYFAKNKIADLEISISNSKPNIIIWEVDKTEILNRLCKKLKSKEFIQKISDFKNLFNRNINTTVKWHGDIGYLVYLLYRLYDTHHLITTKNGKKHFKIAQQYFLICDSRNEFSLRNDYAKILNNIIKRSPEKHQKLRQDVDSMLDSIIENIPTK